jgi:UDP-GlcNAc3NAcA epimerase
MLERHARLILTASGGGGRKRSGLHVPCVTLRDETEWVETLDEG